MRVVEWEGVGGAANNAGWGAREEAPRETAQPLYAHTLYAPTCLHAHTHACMRTCAHAHLHTNQHQHHTNTYANTNTSANTHRYHGVAKNVEPLRIKVKEMMRQQSQSEKELTAIKQLLGELAAEIGTLQTELDFNQNQVRAAGVCGC